MTLIKAENRELTHSRYSSTKGIPAETTGSGTGLLLGTDFRHAVEFSRSGRAAIRPSRAFVTGGLSNHTSNSDVPRSRGRSRGLPGRRGAWSTVHGAFGSRRSPFRWSSSVRRGAQHGPAARPFRLPLRPAS